MLIANASVMSGERSVRDAIKEVTSSRGNFLVAEIHGGHRLLKQSQVRQIVSTSDESELLANIKGNEGEPIVVVPQQSLTRFGISAQHGQLTGNVQGLITEMNQRLALVNVPGGQSFVISASEDHLVDYHCIKRNHPYFPPPPWYEGLKCFCTSEIIREE